MKTLYGLRAQKTESFALQEAFGVVDTPSKISQLICEFASRSREFNNEVENFLVVALNARMKSIGIFHVAKGSVDTVNVYPRDVFRAGIAANATQIIVAHNHPTGVLNPSEADLRVTRELINAGRLLKIPVADHIIFCSRLSFSFRDNNLLDFSH